MGRGERGTGAGAEEAGMGRGQSGAAGALLPLRRVALTPPQGPALRARPGGG